jgi:hypothetical protein
MKSIICKIAVWLWLHGWLPRKWIIKLKQPEPKFHGYWPMMPRMKLLGGDINHEWHVSINNHATIQQARAKEWPGWMYQCKHAVEEVPRLALLFEMERTQKLRKIHRQCSHSTTEQVSDNHLSCCLGEECRKCQHLLSMDQAKILPEQRDWIKAWTCVGHILASGGDVSGEGFLMTVDDRMYWDRVYEHLSMPEPPDQTAQL